MTSSPVLILDDDEDLLEAVGGLLDVMTRCPSLKVRSYDELVHARAQAMTCAVAILDVNLGPGQPSGLDAYHWLRGQRFGGRILFLTGHAQTHPLVREAAALDGVLVLRKPIGLDELRQAVDGSSRAG